MPQRVTGLLTVVFGILGLVILCLLILVGADLRRSARTGPGWKRRLVAAAFTLLAAIGVSAVSVSAVEPPATQDTSSEDATADENDLAKTTEWQTVVAAWKFTMPLAESGKSTTAQRKQADKHIEDAKKAIEQLVEAKLLSEAEAGLLNSEADQISKTIYRNPPTDAMAKCYKIAYVPPAEQSYDRIEKRLPLLKKIAAADKVRPEVLSKVLGSVVQDMAVLVDESEMKKLKPEQQEKAKKLHEELVPLIKRIEAGVSEKDLAMTTEWQTVMAAWKFAMPLAESGKSTTDQRKQADKHIEDAKKAIERLAEAQLLSEAEAGLLNGEVEQIHQAIYRDPPTDATVTCYAPIPFVPPAEESCDRLEKRLPLLKKIAAADRVKAMVLSKVLDTVEQDIAVLADEDEIKKLKPEQQEKAKKLHEELVPLIKQIKDRLAELSAAEGT